MPTASLEFLDSPDYVRVPAVPILDEHVREDFKDGDQPFRVDGDALRRIAANCNARVERTGDACPLVVGHTRDDDPETRSPPIVGYAVNFVVAPFDGREAVYADFYVRKERESVLRDYPRRSVELWPTKFEIDPIALLGATTPERDLGILRFARDPEPRYRYSLESPMPTKVKYEADEKDEKTDAKPKDDFDAAKDAEKSPAKSADAKLDKLIALLEPLVAQLTEALGEGGDDDFGPPDAGGGDHDDLLSHGGDGYGGDGYGGDDEPPPPKKDAAKFTAPGPVKFGSPPSGTNTFVPSGTKEPTQMSRTSDEKVKYERLQSELTQVKRANADLALKYARAEAEKTVAGLEGEGYLFADRGEEVEILVGMGDHAAEHVRRVRENYAKAPVGGSPVARYSRSATGDSDPNAAATEDEARAAADLASRTPGASYEDSLKKVKLSRKTA